MTGPEFWPYHRLLREPPYLGFHMLLGSRTEGVFSLHFLGPRILYRKGYGFFSATVCFAKQQVVHRTSKNNDVPQAFEDKFAMKEYHLKICIRKEMLCIFAGVQEV